MAMTFSFARQQTRLLLLAGALFAFSPLPAQAQADAQDLSNRLRLLENDVQTLNRAVYKGGPVPAAGAPAANLGANEERLSAIEQQQRTITGQIEKLGFDVQQVKTGFERLKADTDQRLQALERGGNAASAAPAPVVTPASSAPIVPPSGGDTLGGADTANALYQDAFAAVRDGRYDDGSAKFQRFLAQYPGHPLSANARYWLGETYYVRGDYKQAAKAFAQGYQDFPKSSKAEDSLYKLSLSLAKLGKTDDACLSLHQMQTAFPAGTGPLRQKAQDQLKQLNCP